MTHEQDMSRKEYRARYWQQYKQGKRRIYGVVTKDEFAEIERCAKENGRAVWRELWEEARAYRQQQFIPSRDVEERITKLYVELRRIGNNLNQIAKRQHTFGGLTTPTKTGAEVRKLERLIADFVARPWRVDGSDEGRP